MTQNREREVTRAFVGLASSLANGNDVLDLLTELTSECAGLLDVASAGVLIANRRGVLHVLAASSDATRDLELFQLQAEQGPCLDCYRDGEPVSVPDLAAQAHRWPRFAEAAADAGFVSVHALPMRFRGSRLGAFNLFGTEVGALNDDDLNLGQALADVASVSLVNDQAASDSTSVTEQLQNALDSRVVIEQAKGLLAQLGDLDMPEAFAALRQFSRDHGQRLTDVARALVTRKLPAQQLLEHQDENSRTGQQQGA